MSNSTGVMITGGDFQGLAVLRSLAQQGIPTIIVDHEHCISRYSRYAQTVVKAPPPVEDEVYAAFLIELARQHGLEGWVVLPINDELVYVLSQHKAALEAHYRIPTPEWDVIQHVYIKEKTYQLAEKHGIAIPRTFYPRCIEALPEIDLEFPVVIKPSIRDHFYHHVKTKAFRADNLDELRRIFQQVSEVIDAAEILVQEFIPGGPEHLYSCCPFFKDGQVVASVTARRRRQHPMEFGHASTYVELVDIPALQQTAATFLQAIDYYGIAEVEFMQDPRSGEYKLIEVNPRFWGWHGLAIAAGVDFPYLWYCDMMGGALVAPGQLQPQPQPMKWVRLLTDIPTVGLELLKGRLSWRDYVETLRGPKTFAVWSRRDPLPFVAELVMIPYLWVKRGF